MSKYCKRCDQVKTDTAFYRMRRTGELTFYCRECKLERGRESDRRNVQSKRARSAKWRENNPDRARILAREWRKRFPEKHVVHQQARRARKASASGSFSAADIAELHSQQHGRCAYCKRPLSDYHVEHRTPLSRGGTNERENICLACPPCNGRKHTKTAEEFMEAGH